MKSFLLIFALTLPQQAKDNAYYDTFAHAYLYSYRDVDDEYNDKQHDAVIRLALKDGIIRPVDLEEQLRPGCGLDLFPFELGPFFPWVNKTDIRVLRDSAKLKNITFDMVDLIPSREMCLHNANMANKYASWLRDIRQAADHWQIDRLEAYQAEADDYALFWQNVCHVHNFRNNHLLYRQHMLRLIERTNGALVLIEQTPAFPHWRIPRE